jgi:type IV secretion system protein VirB5
LRNYLPTDYANLYDAVKKGNAGQIGQAISGLQQQEANYAKTSAAERMALENLTHKAASIAALQAQSARLDNIQNLMSQINYATDAKAASDLQNRISAETAMVQAEQNRLNLMAQ